jgi:hypothetical protein
MTGPFETREQAASHPAVRAIYAAMRADTAGGAMTRGGRDLITAACRAAGVELGAYDARIVEWAAGFEPETSAVIAGLITRAAAAGSVCADLPAVLGTGPAAAALTEPYGVVNARLPGAAEDTEAAPGAQEAGQS